MTSEYRIPTTPNQALQRTRSAVTLAASSLRLSPATQPARQLRESLSLGSLGVSSRFFRFTQNPPMKYIAPAILLAVSATCILRAETPTEREFKLLQDQRNKAIAAADEPINRRYQAALEQLLRRATQSNDLETALKIKQEMGASATSGTPSQEKTHHKWVKAARTDYDVAKKQADAAKGRLPMLKTEADQKSFVTFFAKASPKGAAWLDLNYDDATQKWVWADRTPLTYSNWAKGEPLTTKKGIGVEMIGFEGAWGAAHTWRTTDRGRALDTIIDEAK